MDENWGKYKIFDNPLIRSLIFFPRRDDHGTDESQNVLNLSIPVEADIEISCSFFFGRKSDPVILYFHGNGELAVEYGETGAAFNGIGINLFVADYRGYGRSGGTPSVSSMIKDAHSLLAGFERMTAEKSFNGSKFIMGRSLGSASAIELAAACPHEFKGLIVESGFCDVSDLLARMGLQLRRPGAAGPESPGLENVTRITMPALVIHGEYDSIVPAAQGEKIYRNLGSKDKKLVMIPGADHNDIFYRGMDLYLKELSSFVNRLK